MYLQINTLKDCFQLLFLNKKYQAEILEKCWCEFLFTYPDDQYQIPDLYKYWEWNQLSDYNYKQSIINERKSFLQLIIHFYDHFIFFIDKDNKVSIIHNLLKPYLRQYDLCEKKFFTVISTKNGIINIPGNNHIETLINKSIFYKYYNKTGYYGMYTLVDINEKNNEKIIYLNDMSRFKIRKIEDETKISQIMGTRCLYMQKKILVNIMSKISIDEYDQVWLLVKKNDAFYSAKKKLILHKLYLKWVMIQDKYTYLYTFKKIYMCILLLNYYYLQKKLVFDV